MLGSSSENTSSMTRVYLEVGSKRVFACALDWPGWCRCGRTEADALAALAAYAERYEAVAAEAGCDAHVDSTGLDVVKRLHGSGTTDFGAPGEVAAADRGPLNAHEAVRLSALVDAAWRVFDRIEDASPSELRKGPCGGGRDRDKIADHVLGAEVVYARRLGLKYRQPPHEDRTGVTALRAGILDVLRTPSVASPGTSPTTPRRSKTARLRRRSCHRFPSRFVISMTANTHRLSQSERKRIMDRHIGLIVYPVKDMDRAKALYSRLLEVEPYVASPYYTGFRIGEQEIGLDPNGHAKGLTGPVGYCAVDDINAALQSLVDAGAQVQQEAQDVGGGLLIALVRDADGNITGLRQAPATPA